VEAIAAGATAIYAESQGVRGFKVLRAVPRVGGTWQGCWRHLTCTPDPPGSFNRCNGIIIGDQSVLTLTVAQDRDGVQGTLNYSGVLMDVSGSIAVDGALSVTGSRANSIESVSDWKSTISGSSMEGTFTYRAAQTPGSSVSGLAINDQLVNMARFDVPLTPAEHSLRCRR
jgi:hypothetical protein